jgi:preprotein translocase subunit SecA
VVPVLLRIEHAAEEERTAPAAPDIDFRKLTESRPEFVPLQAAAEPLPAAAIYSGDDRSGNATAVKTSARPAVQPIKRDLPKVGRNDLCPCGSGKKYKKCHGQAG